MGIATRLTTSLRRKSPAKSASFLFTTVFAIHAAIAFSVGIVAWDDGYITLAEARTFAETGHIGLTPYSETVEAATSPAWFLLVTGLCKLGVTGFYGIHLAAQLLTALCAAISAVLLYRIIRSSAPQLAWTISLIALLLGPLRAETANGMEMTLLCATILGIINCIRDSREQPVLAISMLSALIPWVRLEASGYIILSAIAIAVFSRYYRAGVAIIASCTASIVILSICRYQIFGTALLPNTMKAKLLSPYSPPFGTSAWVFQLFQSTISEPLVIVAPAAILGLFLLQNSDTRAKDRLHYNIRRAKLRELSPKISFCVAYFAAYMAFVLAFGSNYFNRPGRMGMSAMLTLIVAMTLAIPVTQSTRRPSLRTKAAVALLALVPYIGIVSEDVYWIYIAHLPADSLAAQASIHTFVRNGKAIDHVRELLGRPNISALIVDVGATSLCCKKIQVLDLGLLANTELTNGGWQTFPSYLETSRPDIVQTHGNFSQEADIYHNLYFRHNYTPVVVYDSLFYLRNDEYLALHARCGTASMTDKYFYSGWSGFSTKKDRPGVSSGVDDDYRKTLPMHSFCRLN